ncbi:DUF4197 domain-containing protein [Aquiflexum gelatinilyticum]|uniref:DUF4197 domain-containing protein n=1 Tax=Aquiflexum gelatinilyticum TaxID=2961943 RepID=A0A9X2SZA1_9BACT|nr:DUF4197 domain-containing protein [Aquiflexum gelatinilyticum]MCR9014193.1 DUF4197 domain-containing protein [Aquiflexum gelatinilyticum]
MRFYKISFLVLFVFMYSCSSAQINKLIKDVTSGQIPLSQDEIAAGLKEALEQGIVKGTDLASKTDGYFKNEMIKILLPEDAQKVEKTLRNMGLGSEVDRALLAINRGAESAAIEAKPIFVNAIKQMNIQDALGILKGDATAATDYLKRTTNAQLVELFKPKIQASLDEVGATKYYGDLANSYNKIPLTKQKVNPDLNAYVTQKAIDGLFVLIAEEEKNIRDNPLGRTSDLMKKVFAQQD